MSRTSTEPPPASSLDLRRTRRRGPALADPTGDQLPPHDTEAEAGALACVLTADQSEAESFLDLLAPEHFYEQRHRTALGALRCLRADGKAPDPVNLSQWLRDKGQVEEAGGLEYLTALPDRTPSPANFPAFLDAIEGYRLRRAAIRDAVEVQRLASDSSVPPAALADAARRMLESNRGACAGRAGLTVRTPDEILAQPQDPHDNILGDRLLAKGQSLTLLGPGGIGKSRIVLQWAAASIAGKPFIGLETHGQGLRWLVFQVENANRRLQSDLKHLREAYRADWATINERLAIHTLETDRDGWLSLDAEENQFAIAETIAANAPDVIVFDPLNQFAIGDPNKDQDMAATCQAITRLCRKGNPQRAISILHHTITGRAGAAKSFGMERAGYGRNSKVLQAWTRGQINLAPISEDDNDLLAVLCGKCSNGKEFPPFAVRLNPETMLYEVAPDVDMDAWRADVAGSKSNGPIMTPSKVRELCHVGGMDKAQLAKAVTEDCGCYRGSAYRYIAQAEKAKLITQRKSDELYFRK